MNTNGYLPVFLNSSNKTLAVPNKVEVAVKRSLKSYAAILISVCLSSIPSLSLKRVVRRKLGLLLL